MKVNLNLLLPALLLFSACSDTELKKQKKQSDYPKIIDSLHIQKLYDKTKWSLYCFYSDDTVNFHKESGIRDTVTFGMLDLRYIETIKLRDTIELRFRFYYKDRLCNAGLIRNQVNWGAKYLLSSDKILWYTSPNGWEIKDSCPDINNCLSRYVKPEQPAVIKYINENKAKLNPWFYKEAKKRGVLKD